MEPFGIGRLFLQVPVVSGTPKQYSEVMILQDISWDVKWDIKELHGPNQFPVAVKRGKASVDGTAKHARIRSDVIAACLLGLVAEAGQDKVYEVTTPHATTIQLSATMGEPEGTTPTVLDDVGAWYDDPDNNNSRPLVRVDADPEAGEYTFDSSSRTYTFNATEMVVSTGTYTGNIRTVTMYSVTAAATTGQVGATHTKILNKPMGDTPTLKGLFFITTGIGSAQNQQFVLELNRIVPYGFKMASGIDDWSKADVPMKAFADSGGNVGTIGAVDVET